MPGMGQDDMHQLIVRMIQLEEKQERMTDDINTLKASMDSNTSALQEFIELGKNLKVGLKILGFIESAAVWLTKVGSAVALGWIIWKYGVTEAVKQISLVPPK